MKYRTALFTKNEMLTLDGRTGEGGGQLVRVATALAALTGQPLRIVDVRGNRRFGAGTFVFILFSFLSATFPLSLFPL